jgi:rRNA maturation protein Nop10
MPVDEMKTYTLGQQCAVSGFVERVNLPLKFAVIKFCQ